MTNDNPTADELEATSIADFEGECLDPFCDIRISPGSRVRRILGTDTFLHERCANYVPPEKYPNTPKSPYAEYGFDYPWES